MNKSLEDMHLNIFFQAANVEIPETFNVLRNIHLICMRDNIIKTLGKWDDDFQRERLKKHYDEFGKSLLFVINKDNHEMIGTINYHLKKFEDQEFNFVEQLYILPEYQGKGVGKYIMNFVAKDEQVRLSVLKNDEKAYNFYKNLGYEVYDTNEYQHFFEKIHLEPKLNSKKNKI